MQNGGFPATLPNLNNKLEWFFSKYRLDITQCLAVILAGYGLLNRKENIITLRLFAEHLINKSDNACLKITANSRYELHINGHWVGNGPVRSWQSPLPVDSYDISKYLQKGKNVIAVLVHHFGIGTNQYILGKPRLIAELQLYNKTIFTDKSWKVCNNDAFAMPASQYSFQQPWEEQFDASHSLYWPVDWRSLEYDDSGWDKATVVTQRSGSSFTKGRFLF